MGMTKDSIKLLGLRATDKVTGFSGAITSVCFDLFGCVQVALNPPVVGETAELKDGRWFDIARLTVSADRVMPVPDFDGKKATPATYDHGPADKPARGY